MIDTVTIPETEPPLTEAMLERLRNAVHEAALWDVVHRPATGSEFPERARSARRVLNALEVQLARLSNTVQPNATSDEALRHSALQEARQNLRMLRSAITGVSENAQGVAILPRVVIAMQETPRAAALADLYLRTVEGDFSVPSFVFFLEALQNHEPLTLNELWNLPAFLGFSLLEALLDDLESMLHSANTEVAPAVLLRLKSLRSIDMADWTFLIEPLIVFDALLRQDPAQSYPLMDFDSREAYRKRVAFIASHSDFTESEVAKAALDLAQESARQSLNEPNSKDIRILLRRTHVGYYLIDKGFVQLAARTSFHPHFSDRFRAFLRTHADDFYISGIQITTIFFIAALVLPPLPHASLAASLATALLLILPAMQCAVDLVNNMITSILDPMPLPKLDFSTGIPTECTTLVTVPTLLLNEKQVRRLVTDLEVRYLANRDRNLHFALLTDLADSVTKPRDKDSDPLVKLATQLVDELNTKYAHAARGSFLLLHRHRVFNRKQGVWMGWERKRGKLLDLNKLMMGEFDAFPIKAGNLHALDKVRYVLTLDSDTQLPRGSAAKLIGAIAHPLNQAVIDPTTRMVTEGYGILQPRIGIAVQSASRSRLAAIYSGQHGFDIYTRAISDAYQDLYGEGIFTGKGIYEAETLHKVLNHRFPRNSLLSHDLIEGAYARAGLASDIELIDDYPSHLNAYNRRKHRWVRGDWQIAQWMFSRVPEESGRRAHNPISDVSRWKIFDNLRRSLVEPFTFILFVAGWLGMPGGPLYWTCVSLLLLVFPTLVRLGFGLGRAFLSDRKGGVREAISGFGQSMLAALFNLVFLPHQTLLCVDAIVRALVRSFITGERLLEWETAAEAESRQMVRSAVDRYLVFVPLVAGGVAGIIFAFSPNHNAILIAAPILALWVFSVPIAAWLNAPPREERRRLNHGERNFLLSHALRIWRYFDQFGKENHNYLIPDNVEEDGLREAPRVSPTNIGLLLNARQAACEFGFLTIPEFVELTQRSLATIARLEKHRGHLYNWYDTQTLEPLGEAPFVSTVDSGNFAASLYTLHSGVLQLGKMPMITHELFAGLHTHWLLMESDGKLFDALTRCSLPQADAPFSTWIAWLPEADAALVAACEHDDGWWLHETRRRVSAMRALLGEYMPWMLTEYAPLRELPELSVDVEAEAPSIDEAPAFTQALHERLNQAIPMLVERPQLHALAERLGASLYTARERQQALAEALRRLALDSERLAEETEFAFLVSPDRKVLSIGYDVRGHKLHDACYDMMASEARIATFLAIARDELPQQSWFKLSREHTRAFGRFALLSWSGTMFEYLMPSLWMRSYSHTLISRTLAACVQIQRTFAGTLKLPWGISESGASMRNDSGHYHYHAYGIPQISLWPDANAGPVVSPYSSFLALSVDSLEAVGNLRHMESAGWTGAFGFYEAADYSVTQGKAILVREWMAHHLGMSLLAMLNLLHDNVVQRWFHANPLIQATELVLHEKPVSIAVLEAKLKG